MATRRNGPDEGTLPRATSPLPPPSRLALSRDSAGLRLALAGILALGTLPSATGAEYIELTGVPDYEWHMGCFGTATGNLAGYWDRHGFPEFYTGPTQGGLAPLTSFGANRGILSLWATQAGVDGRPLNQPGHVDDYWVDYESTARDPWETAGRSPHAPDCLGDFIGLNQHRWPDLAGECSGNIDGYSFNAFDPQGRRRTNYVLRDAAGTPIPDLQSGLREWAAWRGVGAETFSQLADFNPDIRAGGGTGFSFADLRAEIDAGYPVLLFMQAFGVFSRTVHGVPGQNPLIHGMLAYGYVIDDDGTAYVRYRTSWASGDNQFSPWNDANWTPNGDLNLPLRGVIGFHPRPRLTRISRAAGRIQLEWHGPNSRLRDAVNDQEWPVHAYVVERSPQAAGAPWEAITDPVTGLSASVPECCGDGAFYRVRLVAAP